MKIIYCMCGSFCTFERSLKALERLVLAGHEIIPVMSENAYSTDTRFGTAAMFRERIISLTGKDIIHTIAVAEPIGPIMKPDILIISPCTGNTLAKLANGITDTSVTMAAKSVLRSDIPVKIALATNDALGANLSNIAILRNRKGISFVPMKMDDPINKPYSLVAEFEKLSV